MSFYGEEEEAEEEEGWGSIFISNDVESEFRKKKDGEGK